ncbi:Gfo/Idh/MocA family oxidoreductase [Planotetraspora sp. A-T 1434]|uniref:Gfo/Idh/MocA family protein n=1 Tax=Planotetraspora sp. A-T 1434 TaxID=2979219 RepID=UPI0021BE4F9F|nr:Gfo/Idh/MocA family oxidoreductase [Planotetraspora sp. A-T 1434]MCT9930342.1 Gfo/Idh/MocA family oxidoreductase [Planotetraspora sp. A-T 1434]
MRRYAFVGLGHRAATYFDALLSDYRDLGAPVALCDTNPARMALYGRSLGLAAYRAEDFTLMLEKERPDVVVVTTPDFTHHHYVCAALDHGRAVVVEKPLTTTAEGCAAIAESARDGDLTVTFNYRYSPRNSEVKRLLLEGAIGTVTSVHFEWVLDTMHGADYFRRWHRDKANSGGLLVHKATHHFDLVNWWLGAAPRTVYAQADLRFYGSGNAPGPRPARGHGSGLAGTDPFTIDLAAHPRLKELYLDTEHEDGYLRDQDVFAPGVTIEDNMSVLVRYDDRALLTYSLNAHAPWEGYRVAFNGTEGRLELDVVEREWAAPESAPVLGRGARRLGPADADRVRGERIVLQRHWEPAREVAVPTGTGGHGGGDRLLLDDVFRGTAADPLGRRAGVEDGIRGVLVGVAANRSIDSGGPVHLADGGLRLA